MSSHSRLLTARVVAGIVPAIRGAQHVTDGSRREPTTLKIGASVQQSLRHAQASVTPGRMTVCPTGAMGPSGLNELEEIGIHKKIGNQLP